MGKSFRKFRGNRADSLDMRVRGAIVAECGCAVVLRWRGNRGVVAYERESGWDAFLRDGCSGLLRVTSGGAEREECSAIERGFARSIETHFSREIESASTRGAAHAGVPEMDSGRTRADRADRESNRDFSPRGRKGNSMAARRSGHVCAALRHSGRCE